MSDPLGSMMSTSMALPIAVIGPGPAGNSAGAVSATSVPAEDKTKVEGEKAKPAPMIPPEVEMSDTAESRLVQYLTNELDMCRGERYPYISKLARLMEKYRAPFPEYPKDWPIANASQITVPIIKTAVNTLSARIYQTLMAAEPMGSVRTEDPEYQDFANDLEKFLDIYSDVKLDIGEVLDSWSSEIITLGTGVLEPTTLLDRRVGMTYDTASGDYTRKVEDVYSGPIVYHIPIEDFWIRVSEHDPQTAPWCGKEIRRTWSQMKDMALSGEIDPDKLDNVWKFPRSDGDVPPIEKKQEDIEKLRPNDRDQYRLYELAVRWDCDGDGLDEELMVLFHYDSHTLLRRKFSGFKQRPWRAARFVTIPHQFYGEGLAEMLEHIQEEISTTHNQRIDNASIANLKIILVSRMIQGLRPGDRLWTGKIVKVSDTQKDVGTLQLGDIYPSTVMNENISKQYANELSGIGETATGTARPVSRTTATAQLALLEELNRRFDKFVKNARRCIGKVYTDLTDLFTVTGTGGLAEEWLGPVRGRRLENYLSLPSDVLRKKIKIRVLATRSTVNREVEFQSQLAVFQLITQLWAQVLPLAQQMSPTIVPVLAHEILNAIIPVFRKVMQYADAPDPDKAISVLTVLERILPAPEDLGGMGAAQADQTQALLQQLAERARGVGGGPNAAEETAGTPGVPSPATTPGRANGRRSVGTAQRPGIPGLPI